MHLETTVTITKKLRWQLALAYLFLLISPMTLGITGLLSLIICSLNHQRAEGGVFATHGSWIMRSYFFSWLWFILGIATMPIALGYGILVVNFLWFYYRVIHGYSFLRLSKPLY